MFTNHAKKTAHMRQCHDHPDSFPRLHRFPLADPAIPDKSPPAPPDSSDPDSSHFLTTQTIGNLMTNNLGL
jgi:hypothetical protein